MIYFSCRQIRKSRNLSQQDIANKLDVNQTSVSQWERGVTMPNISTLSKLCEILETSSDYLLGISDDVITKQWEDKSTVAKLLIGISFFHLIFFF